MLRQRTESFKAHFESVPRWTETIASKTVAWVLAGALITGGLFYVVSGTSNASLEPLFGGQVLRDVEMDQIELAFGAEGLSGWKRDQGRILIPHESRHQYLAVLKQSAALPYSLRDSLADSEDSADFFESESERKRRQEREKARELGRKITTFGDIARASVYYDARSAGGFDQSVIQSASVALIPADGQPISPAQIRMIQDFICGAYAGMQPDQVTVIDASSRKTFRGDEDLLVRRRRQAEYELEQRLGELLSGYKGLRIAATSVVTASDLDPLAAETPSPRPRESNRVHSVGVTELAMRVSVGVPESQFHRQWIGTYHSRYPESSLVQQPTAEQIQAIKEKVFENIRDAVSPFIAADGYGDSVSDAIHLWSFPDANENFQYADAGLATLSLERLTLAAKEHIWFVAPTVCLLAIASAFAFSALVMRLRSTTAAPTVSAPTEATRRESRPMATGTRIDSSQEHVAVNEASLKDDLADMVEQNPELAAQIVHSWMVDAA